MASDIWLWLASGMGFGTMNTGDLLDAYPDGAQAVYNDLGGPRLDEILTQKQEERLAATRPEDFALGLAHAERMGIHALPFDSPDYPDMLRSITNPPLILFVKGDLSLLNGQLAVGVVGARRPTAYGVEAVKTIGRGIAMGGAIIVSGLAAGLDAEAHKAALAVNGPTIACVAFGLDNCYPASNRKLMEVIERYGAVISEYPLGTTPEKPYFLQRNRLIAGLSHALLVVEARRQSGTMSTVNFATDYGRDVFAVPGNIFSELCEGTNAMIREGAYLASSAADILSLYGVDVAEAGEDAIARQAAEGRPAAAEFPAHPQAHYTDVRPEEEPPAEGQIYVEHEPHLFAAGAQPMRAVDETASAQKAINTLRRMQREAPPDAEAEARRNRMLDEMVAAVTDSVELSSLAGKDAPVRGGFSPVRQERFAPLQGPAADGPDEKTEKKDEGRVSLFNWGAVKHLSREELAKDESAMLLDKPVTTKKRDRKAQNAEPLQFAPQQTIGAQRQNLPQNSPAPAAPQEKPAARSVRDILRLAPIERVEQVEPAGRVQPAVAVAPARQAAQDAPAPAMQAPQAEQAVPPKPGLSVFSTQQPKPKTRKKQAERDAPGGELNAANLAGRLRTMQKSDGPRIAPAAVNVAQKPKTDSVAFGAIAQKNTAQKPLDTFAAGPVKRAEEKGRPAARQTAPAPQDAPRRTKPDLPPLSAAIDFEKTVTGDDARLSGLSAAARKAYRQLGPKPVTLRAICDNSGLSSGEAMAALTELELAGLSRQQAGRQFILLN